MTLRVVPVSDAEARAFTRMWHRHHGHVLPAGCKFRAGVADELDILRGVAITGRPGGRGNQDGTTVEVTRCTTDGTKNACTMLYGASARTAKAQGWRRIITYTQEGESGASLKAAGFVLVAEREPRTDHFESSQRYREDHGQGGGPPLLVGAGAEPFGEAMEGSLAPYGACCAGDAASIVGGCVMAC